MRYDTARLQLYMYMCGRSCELELYRSWMLLVSESLDARRWQHVRTCDVRSPIFVISFSFSVNWQLCGGYVVCAGGFAYKLVTTIRMIRYTTTVGHGFVVSTRHM